MTALLAAPALGEPIDPEWRAWGPYLSERQWGTVREVYSEGGAAWESCPHDHARSRAYRWGEDGLLGVSDEKQHLCFALALWNGQGPILKERLYGLTGSEGNHGEDVKEYYYYLSRFRAPGIDHLADVVDGPDGDDWTPRPNQVFAVSLPYPLLEGADAGAALAAVGRALLASYGLRSLAQDDPAYRGAALAVLRPMGDHLRDAGLGSVSEIYEGDPPHLPKGCVAQAWGVAEVLRVRRRLDQAQLG